MKIKKAIITAAGFGSRFLPFTKIFPKEMLPIIDKPIVHYIVQECSDAGLEEIIIVSAPDEVHIYEDYFFGQAEHIRSLLEKQGKLDRWTNVEKIFNLPKITVIPEDRSIPYGNGRPIISAKSLVENEEAFVVCWGDDLVLSDVSAVKQIVDFYEQNPADGILQVIDTTKEIVSKGGQVIIKEGTENEVKEVIEKAPIEEITSTLYSYGRYVCTPLVFNYLTPSSTGKDGEVWLADALDKVSSNHKMLAQVVDGEFYTTGDPESYLKAQNAFYERYRK